MINVLYLAANASHTSQHTLDEQVRDIDAKIRAAEHRDRIRLIRHAAVRLDDLSELLMRFNPVIVHFCGQSALLGEINSFASTGPSNRDFHPPTQVGEHELTESNSTSQARLPTPDLAKLLRILKDDIRVVLLDRCYSEVHAKAFVEYIDCAVCMDCNMEDNQAVAFAKEFYQALGYGRSVQEAFDLGLYRLTVPGLAMLHTRDQVDASKMMLLQKAGDTQDHVVVEPRDDDGKDTKLHSYLHIDIIKPDDNSAGDVIVDVGFQRFKLTGFQKGTEPIMCGCGNAKVTTSFDLAVSASDPSIPVVPAGAEPFVIFGTGPSPSVRFKAKKPNGTIEGRGRILYRLRTNEANHRSSAGTQARIRGSVRVEPEWFSPERPTRAEPHSLKGLNGAARILVDTKLRVLDQNGALSKSFHW